MARAQIAHTPPQHGGLSDLFTKLEAAAEHEGLASLSVLRVCRTVSWLPHLAFGGLQSAELELERLADGLAAPSNTRGLGLSVRVRAIVSSVTQPDPAIEQLRATLMATALFSLNARDPAINGLAKLILGVADKRDHGLRQAMLPLRHCNGLEQAQRAVLDILRNDADRKLRDLAEQLQQCWAGKPFVRLFNQVPATQARKTLPRHAEGDAVTVRVSRVSYSVPSQRGLDPTGVEAQTSTRTGQGGDEHPDDGSDSFVNYAELALRRSNQFLVPGHIDALTDAEAAHLADALHKIASDNPGTPDSSHASAILLSLTLGISPEKLGEIQSGSGGGKKAGFHLDTKTGLFWRPFALHPSAENESLTLEDWVTLPLPPKVLEVLRQPTNAPQGVQSISLADVRDVLARHNIELATSQLARIWHWASTRIQAEGTYLAATMAITGNTFARSPAPLYYYKPKLRKLQSIYARSIWPAFGDTPAELSSSDESRVGFAVLVDERLARRACQSIADKGRIAAPTTGRLVDLAVLHNRINDTTAARFCVNSLHRPTNALFKIRRWDISLSLRAAMLLDKRVDASHYLRFAALSQGCTDQVAALLEHLQALLLKEDLPAATRAYVGGVLSGHLPLFFHLTSDGEIARLRIESWHASLPDRWKALKPNWYRTYVATALLEAGANGDATAIQLGHLEAAGFPFDATSPLSFASLANYLRPFLDAIDSNLSLPCIRGLARGQNQPVRTQINLPDWGSRLDSNQKWMQHISTRFARFVRRSDAALSDESRTLVLEAIGQHCPALASALHGSADQDAAPGSDNSLTASAFRSIVDDIESHSDDPIKSIALRNELAAQLRKARKGLKWQVPLYSRVVIGPSADPSPLMRGLLEAIDCVDTLRRRWLNRYDSVDMQRRTDHLVLGFLLWSPPIGLEDLKRCLPSLDQAERAHETELVVVPLHSVVEESLARQQSSSLTAIPAILAARLRGTAWSDFDWEDFAAFVSDFIAPSSAEKVVSPLDWLISLLRAAAIIEQPQLALYATDVKRCVSAHAERRHAMHGGKRIDDKSATARAVEARERYAIDEKSPEKRRRDREYDRLKAILSAPTGKAKVFAITGREFGPERQKKVFKDAMVAELSAFSQSSTDALVSDLASFAQYLLEHGTQQRPDPAISTVSTYLGSIATRLLGAFEAVSPREIDPDERLEQYQKIVSELSTNEDTGAARPADLPVDSGSLEGQAASGVKTQESKVRITSSLCAFDRFITARHGLEPTELDALEWPDFDEDASQPTSANFVTQGEYEATLRLILQAANDDAAMSPPMRRQYRAAAVLLVLIYRAGLRITEACFLLIRDITFIGDQLHLVVKNNQFRRMKNPLRKRLALSGATLDKVEQDLLRGWLSDQIELARGDAKSLLFALSAHGADPFDQPHLRKILKRAFLIAAGVDVWPHLLRHSCVHVQVTDSMNDGVDGLWPLGMTRTDCRRIADRIGHADFQTTLRYFHEPDRLSVWIPTPQGSSSRDALRKFSGLSLAAFDKRIVRNHSRDPKKTCQLLVSSAWDARSKRDSSDADDPSRLALFTGDVGKLSLGLLDTALAQAVSSERSPRSTALALGWTDALWDRVEECARRIRDDTSYELLARRLPQQKGSEAILLRAWSTPIADRQVNVLGGLFELWYRTIDRRKAIGLTCHSDDADKATQAMAAMGVSQGHVFIDKNMTEERSRPVRLGIRSDPTGRELPHLLFRFLALCALGRAIAKSPWGAS